MFALKTLGERFAEARRRAELTQEQVAERVGCAVETIGRLERGVQVPPLLRLSFAAETIGIELEDLVRRAPRGRREEAVDRLVRLLRSRSADDAELVADLAERIFQR